MSIVIESGSSQYIVEYGDMITVDRIEAKEGDVISLDLVYAYGDDESVTEVAGKVVEHKKGKKIRVIKYKSKSNYLRTQGHRSHHTVIEIVKGKGSAATKSAPTRAKKATPKAEAKPVEEAPAAKPAPAKTTKSESKPDDLTKIEGIGPKIATTLNDAGILTFAQLSEAKAEDISKMIEEVRGNHDPKTWPKQSKLAADGEWDKLKTLQDELDGGK